MFKLNSKNETIKILCNYFRKFDTKELVYYLENYNYETIPEFLEANIYDPKDIELLNLLIGHLKIVINKVFYITTPINLKRFPIKLSFKTNSIYWDELFVIEDTIFISYQYLIKIFENIEYNKYKSIDKVYLCGNKIYDMELMKKLCESVYYTIQFTNFEYWKEYICDKYDCYLVDKSIIKFKNNYNILKEPNTSFTDDKIPVYWSCSGEIYTVINLICSDIIFSPYWKEKTIKLKYIDGQYIEIDIDINKNKNMYKFSFYSNPFVSKAKQLTECIIYNK
jgi:hypothetical protein